ncbi:MAG: hypothetical protein JNJ50_27280 [Acidobacteria bacterium]|nr:hypothetical protein [Acidobacteriota bacterium]
MMLRRITNYLARKQGTILTVMLSFIFLLFISILVTTYIVSKRANPILLDETGRPIPAQAGGHH